MLDNKIKDELRLQKILPILNTTELSKDIRRLEDFTTKSKNIKYIEITLRKKNSLEIAKSLRDKFPKYKFGLGSILSLDDYKKGKDNGFNFFVSPGIVKDIIEINPLNYIPGGETISEFIFLINNSYKTIKFFPSNIVGGEKKLLSIQNILKNVKFIPTGGINNKNIVEYLKLNNVLCVGMSNFE